MKGSDYLSYEELLYQIFFDEFLVDLMQTTTQYLNSGNYGGDLAKTIVVYYKSNLQDKKCFQKNNGFNAFSMAMRNFLLAIVPGFFLCMMLSVGNENSNQEAAETFQFLGSGITLFLIMMFLVIVISYAYYNRKGPKDLNKCVTTLYHCCANTFITKEDYEYLAKQNIYFKKLCIKAGILEEKKELE